MIPENEIICKVLEHWQLILFVLLVAGPALYFDHRRFTR